MKVLGVILEIMLSDTSKANAGRLFVYFVCVNVCVRMYAPCPSKQSSFVQPSIGVLFKQIILNIFYFKPVYMFGGLTLGNFTSLHIIGVDLLYI